MPPLRANITVKSTEPAIPPRNVRRPPRKSERPPETNLPMAYARTPSEAMKPRRILAKSGGMPRAPCSWIIMGSATEKLERQR